MDDKITPALIALGGVVLSLLCTIIYNKQKDKKAVDNTKRQTQREVLKEKRDFNKKKLDEFYYPLKRYLQESKDLFKIFIHGKPEGFRTLTYLLNPTQFYPDDIQVTLSKNDNALLKAIFEKGTQIQNLITTKSSIIDDNEFVDEYMPSAEFRHITYPNGLNLLGLLAAHLKFIKIAYDGDLTGEIDTYSTYVFPNEVNYRVDAKITELVDLVSDYNSKMATLVEQMEG